MRLLPKSVMHTTLVFITTTVIIIIITVRYSLLENRDVKVSRNWVWIGEMWGEFINQDWKKLPSLDSLVHQRVEVSSNYRLYLSFEIKENFSENPTE